MRSTDPYWVGYLSTAIARYLDGSHSKSDLQAALRVFLRSPVATPKLRAILTNR